ncbi:sensor histidine kinase [Clostridium chromiireducens]|uniref:sensor histidine kinase n=1 Tax=Clostridium chromiireducens TaxID=225345 RepID=UPI003AF6A181
MKKDIFLSTKKKIIATSTIVVFTCLIVFAIITQILYSSRVLDNIDHQLIEQKKFFLQQESDFSYEQGLNKNDVITRENGLGDKFKDKSLQQQNKSEGFSGRLDGKPVHIPPNLIVIIYKNNTFEAMSKNLYFSEESLPVIPLSAENEIVTITSSGYSFRGIVVNNGEYKIQVLANIDAEERSLSRLRNSIIASLIILIILATLLSAYLASKVIKPIREAYEKQVYFVQDASHEMRTPLAVIKGKLELLAHSWGDTIDNHFEHISKMMTEVRGLEKLNSDLLLLSKEDLDLAVNITSFKLNDFIDDLSEFYLDLAEIKEKTFKVNGLEEDISVQWDYDKIKRSIVILIENAFKYTNENGEIILSVEDMNKYVKISVKDNGIGIKEEEQSRIFDRFYRSEAVRGENISGTGIGLSLLKSISKNFGIKLKVDSEYGSGSEFILMIPKIIK